MFIILIILLCIALFTYLIILGSNMNKSEEERKMEDQEQIEYLRKIKEKKNNEYK